jgi:hypothetical protein
LTGVNQPRIAERLSGMVSLSWDHLSPAVKRLNSQLKDVLKAEKKSKYHSKKVMIDGITFDSQKEANRYCDLLLEQRAGLVDRIELQPSFLLQAGYMDSGKKVRDMYYVADFQVWYKDGRIVVIDTKGFKTQVYRMKKKLFRRKYPDIDFVEE